LSVLDRAALEESPLADLHAIASELSIDGYRRLRRPELIDAILARQGDETPSSAGDDEPEAADELAAEERGARDEPASAEPEDLGGLDVEDLTVAVGEQLRAHDAEQTAPRRRRGRRGGRGRPAREDGQAPQREEEPEEEEERETEDEIIEGLVELLPNGSGFVRVQPPDPSDDDVYISAAQVKRCELVSGDQVSGPRRAPRRSERFASMVRIDAINGRPAEEMADSARFEDLPAAFPDERFRLGSEDPTIKAIEWLTPFGRGSRVTIVGAARAGKSEALSRLASALAELEGLQVSVALAGVRPEEIPEWSRGPLEPAAAISFAASPDAQGQTVERVVDQARRLAARGANAVVLIDTLEGLHPHVARKVMASARRIVDGGSLTVIATASAPVGGETTVIALDAALASTGRFPALDLVASGTIRPELLVGEAGAEAIARARAEAVGE
jgi:transcription termination factor Rho